MARVMRDGADRLEGQMTNNEQIQTLIEALAECQRQLMIERAACKYWRDKAQDCGLYAEDGDGNGDE